jgi:predicted secreted hydrolase
MRVNTLSYPLVVASIVWASALCSGFANTWIEPPLRTTTGYTVPQPDNAIVLPAAHGAHPQYAIEWWYWVGHLEAVEGVEAFGFQSTVFRLAGDPATDLSRAGSAAVFGDQQLYMSHAALSEISAQRYHSVERVNREGWQARAATGKLDLWATPIRAHESADGRSFDMDFKLPDTTQVSLTFTPLKPIVSFGQRGLSRKGADPAAVSLYWTYTRLQVEGRIIRQGVVTEVQGVAWQDHEIASSQLGSDLEGWDWTAIQLDDGTEVKAYRLRKADGGSDPWSAVYWIDEAAQVRGVYADQFQWQEDAYWTSPQTGQRYPTSVSIEAIDPRDGRTKHYRLRPLLDAQEFIGNRSENPYWEGACLVLDASGQEIGRAYLELAGYGGGLASELK